VNDPPPAWLAAAYDQGRDDMAATIASLITDQLARGDGSAATLDAVVALVIGRLEIGLPQDQWFRRQGR
jgi:hypothetical protein